MNVLAVGAHFDDLELGCGGALAKHHRNGDNVIGFVATNSKYENRKKEIIREGKTALDEAELASSIIGYRLITGDIPTFHLKYGEKIHTKLLGLIEENHIDMIYTHWIYDVHHDHRNLALAALHVSRHVNRVLMYRSNWYPSEQAFMGNFFVDITETWVLKERAIRAYQSEMNRVGERWVTYFKQEAVNNGFQVGVEYAEAFQLVKWII